MPIADAGGMYSFAIAAGGVSEQMWQALAARRALSDALDALDSAAALLASLVADTDWQSAGVRALHAKLAEFRGRTDGEAGDIYVRWAELERFGGL